MLHSHLKVKGKLFSKEELGAAVAEVHRAGGPLGLVLLPRCTLSEPGTSGSVLGLSEPTYGRAVPGAGLGVGGGSTGHVLPLCPVFQGGLISQINAW